MKISYICIIFIIFVSFLGAQYPDYDTTGPFVTVSYRIVDIPGAYETMDDSRIYYPSSGNQVNPAAVPCPIIVFGHGFQMDIDRYYTYAQHLASWGYIVVLPTISNPFPTPEHYTRAHSMVDAAMWTASLDTTPGDIFYNCLARFKWGFAGHSMGGAISLLAADTFKLFDTLKAVVSLASPQTTPPTHSQHLITPKMIIAGSIDNIAPWNEVRSAFWANAPAPGTFAVIHGANHGYFMDYSYFWENGGTATITRPEQLRIARRHMTAYFQRYLRNDTTTWNYHYCYGDSINHHPTMDTVEVRYGGVQIYENLDNNAKKHKIKVIPNPFVNFCQITGEDCKAEIINSIGQKIGAVNIPGFWYPAKDIGAGVYYLKTADNTFYRIIFLKK